MRISDWSSAVCSSDLLLAPTNGTVLFGGQPLQGVNRGVGYMTQGDTLLPWRTVAANVGLPLSLRNMGRAESSELVDRFLDLLDLKAAANKYPSELSGGMKRRALLARSLIYEPSRSEEHTSELQSLMRISYAVFCLKKKNQDNKPHTVTY